MSRSTSNLPQVEVGGQPHDDDMLDKLGKQDVKPASPTKSKPSSPDAIGKLTTSEKSGKPSMPDKKGKAVLDTQKQDELEQQDRDSSGVTVQEEAGSGGDILEGKECVTVKGITEEDVPVISVGKVGGLIHPLMISHTIHMYCHSLTHSLTHSFTLHAHTHTHTQESSRLSGGLQ